MFDIFDLIAMGFIVVVLLVGGYYHAKYKL